MKRSARGCERQDRIDPRAFSADGYIINQGVLRDIRYGARTSRETGCGWIACYNYLRCMGMADMPVNSMPVKAEPVKMAPIQVGLEKMASAEAGPEKGTSVQAGPEKGAPVQAGPEKGASVQAGPAKAASVQVEPVKAASAKVEPAKTASAEVEPIKVARDMEKMLLWGGRIGSHPLAVWWYLHRKGCRFRAAFTRRGAERALERCSGKKAGIITYWHGKGAHYVAFTETGNPGEPVFRYFNASYGVERDCRTVAAFFKRYVRFPLVIVLAAR